MKSLFVCFVLALLSAAALPAAATLDFYVIDVEGGKAMIVTNPSGQAMLIDGGMPGIGGRDLKRVEAAAQAAGVKKFDVALVTHYDVDHVGNIPAIDASLPITLLVDHGPLLPNPKMGRINRTAADAYLAFLRGRKRLSVKSGDVIPFKDVRITVLTSAEQVLSKPLSGGGKVNGACPEEKLPEERGDDNASSIGTLWQFGKFRMADFADLLKWVELKLMCPKTPVGPVDLFMVSHHGLAFSNSAALIHGLQPKVAISNNGERKGIAPDVTKVLRSSPGLQDIWQLHYSTTAGPDLNTSEDHIANMKAQGCEGHWIKVSVRRDGTFTVTNSRNNVSKTYKP